MIFNFVKKKRNLLYLTIWTVIESVEVVLIHIGLGFHKKSFDHRYNKITIFDIFPKTECRVHIHL